MIIAMVQRGHDQLVDVLLNGWWCGKWESESPCFRFQQVWRLCVCEQHTINFSNLVGVSVSAKQLNHIVTYICMYVCIPVH